MWKQIYVCLGAFRDMGGAWYYLIWDAVKLVFCPRWRRSWYFEVIERDLREEIYEDPVDYVQPRFEVYTVKYNAEGSLGAGCLSDPIICNKEKLLVMMRQFNDGYKIYERLINMEVGQFDMVYDNNSLKYNVERIS